jgi:hypothetical protein
MAYQELISAQYGTYVVNDTTEAEKNAIGIYVSEDTVFSRIEVDGATATDVKANYISTAGTAVKAGVTLTPQGGDDYFSAITLTSGSVVLILKDA